MKKSCPNCEEPKSLGKPCDECGFWTPEDAKYNDELRRVLRDAEREERLHKIPSKNMLP